ncbi:MAG: glycosyltransferase family 4 protein [Acidimicrobiaceae bacterium]|nr:glycosyltransferase family 4 protein [Acidimicrobiaceae bacterium]
MTTVHQLVPTLSAPSAITTHVLEAAKVLRNMGIETKTYAEHAEGVPPEEALPFSSYPAEARRGVWLLYQLSIGHAMGDFLQCRPEPIIVNYHNITPAKYFRPWEPLFTGALDQGRAQLRRLAKHSVAAIADSAYNRNELDVAGYRDTGVVPVLVDYDALGSHHDEAVLQRLQSGRTPGGAEWLFVGRISPNKAQHQLIRALAVYRRLYDPQARLTLAGGSSSHAYLTALTSFAQALGVSEGVRFTGPISQPEMVSYYLNADVFVSASEHEGFCIPVVEAMWHRVPIVALASSAVRETVDDAGILIPTDADRPTDPAVLAAAVHRAVTDANLRCQLVTAGERRASDFDLTVTSALFAEAVKRVIGS